MGYRRSLWWGGGRGGDAAVVRCLCSEEKVKISWSSVGDDRGLRRVFALRRFESPRLSTASISSDERAPSATPSDCADLPPSDRRPVSLISTLSSGSGSSRDDNLAPPPLSGRSSDPDINLNLSPSGGAAGSEGSSPQSDRKGRSLVHSNNNNNKDWAASRASSRRQPASPFISGSMAPNPQLTYLDRVLMEIIETERMYVRDLRMIVEDYLAHIIDQSDLSIRPEQVCSLFGNIEDIYEFNSELLQALDLCDNDPVAVARCFVMKSEYFDIYTQYCTNYPNSVAALTECMRNKSLAKFFRERQASLKRSLPLGSYLLKPVQRILKYHLLLQEIAKHFDPEEKGYEVVEEAIYTMTGVAWYINDMKRKHEHAVRLQEVQSLLLNWKGPDLTTYGELVLEGTFKVHRAKNERTLFLFDRMLLITKRRGEHYAYKTHISCSTLMLIESAKDSLSFSVTHYKHPKQPHTVQAKTVEEKKLWAHHIKRIILENHHAIIPQKAKEAILEMDSIYPPRYRYSPERLKKALSCPSDEFPRDARQSRRQSEPIKHTAKSSRAVLELSGGGGALPGDSSRGGSEADRPAEEEEDEEEEEELGSRKDSLERLMCSEEEEDDEFLEEEQVEDFASSVLAAISCWHDTVQAFLSSTGTEAKGGGASSNSSNKENGQLPEEDETGGADPTPEQASDDKLPQTLTPTENREPEQPSDLNPPGISAFPHKSEELKPEGDPEPRGEPSSATPDSDSKTLSSGESSEDEEDEKEAAGKELESPSILPSSVLDKASAIAQHFTNSIKRGSVAQDDARSLGCASPRLPSRTGSTLSLAAETADRSARLNSISADAAETFGATDLNLLSPGNDSLFDDDRGIQWRRDSTLSKQDQLLIGKIKTYYENAGNEDATFSFQRRESLTYIPTGLVRSSVSRFNSIPKDETIQTSPSTTSSSLDTNYPDHMLSSESLDSLKSDQRSGDPEYSGELHRSRSQSMQSNPSEDEEFRPSSEMIKIWQAMERKVTKSQTEDGGRDRTREAQRASRAAGAGAANPTRTSTKSCDRESGASDLSTITEESTSPSPPKSKIPEVNRTGSLKDALKVFGDEAVALRAPVPRVAQLRAEAEGERPGEDPNQPDDADKAKSKVLHLARQYSQRIKTTKPVVRQRSQGGLIRERTLSCVEEEKEGSGTVTSCLPSDLHHRSAAALPNTKVCCSQVDLLTDSSIFSSFFQISLRRHSSCSSGLLLLTDEDPSYRPRGGREEISKRLHRANSLDPRLGATQMTELQKLQDQVANGNCDGYYIAAEAPLPNNPGQKVIVVEKLPETQNSAKEPKEEDDVDDDDDDEDDGYVQIRSPTSREKISIMAVIDRCRAYQESDEYKQREESKVRTEPARPQELDKTAAASGDRDESQRTRSNGGQKTETGQQSIVRNLREKFQSRS
ncbi:pleckstrin homology domain-containing family G member 3 [Brachyistius frenatus]|uniref:pleckstrin homology domain-containing family G member 3 n=1 Tax=Brachyistius frenatus TaxID=100188 RepID=UPI0037E97014